MAMSETVKKNVLPYCKAVKNRNFQKKIFETIFLISFTTMSSHSGGGSSSHSRYKDIYKDMKHELKRKKRDIEDLEDQLRREEQDSKKLKSENHDLWKLYYGLQQELAAAYERNTKIQGDKAAFEALFERERQDWERQRLEFASSIDECVKLKSALCNMQKEKLAMQKKFNDLVVENKTLKEKEREIEPKLREIDELKKKLVEFETLLVALQSGFAKQRRFVIELSVPRCLLRYIISV